MDGGEEIMVDCYSVGRIDNVVLFETDTLPAGTHVIKVRVTGEQNSLASGSYVNVDRVVVD